MADEDRKVMRTKSGKKNMMILDPFTMTELKELAKAREIDIKGISGKENLISKIEQDFYQSTNIFPHLRTLTPVAKAVLEYMSVVLTEVTVNDICTFLALRKLIKSASFYDRGKYWDVIKQELVLQGLVMITQKEAGYKKKEAWYRYKLAIPSQFASMIPTPELPGIELTPQGMNPFSCLDFFRELILYFFGKTGLGSIEAWPESDISPIALQELVETIADKLVCRDGGIFKRDGKVPQLDGLQTILSLLVQEITADKLGRIVVGQLKRLKHAQWCEWSTLENAVREYGLLEKAIPLERCFSMYLLPSGFGQRVTHQERSYCRLAPEIFSYLTAGALPVFAGDETASFDRKRDQITFQCFKANPATLWQMMFLGQGKRHGERLTFTTDKVRMARLQKIGIDPAPLFASLNTILPPSFARQYAEFRSELGKNTLYFHYTPIQINDEALAFLLQSKLPELVPLGNHFYLLDSAQLEQFHSLLKKNGYLAKVVE
jgi:hypothetical protein